MPRGEDLKQIIDNYVLDQVQNERIYRLETLVIDSYDHLTDIRGTKRMKSAMEIAEIRHYNQLERFLQDVGNYQVRTAVEQKFRYS